MSNELTDVRCPCGAEFQADSYDAGFIAGSGMCQNCDAALPPKDICTCPSGDGSLRHPCQAHPAPVEQAGGDERDFQAKGAQEVPSPVSKEYDRHLISLLRKGEALPAHQEEAADEIERLRDWNDHLNNTVLPNILNPNFLMLMKGGERLLDLCTKDGEFIGVSLNDMKDVFDWMVTHARIAPDQAALAQPSPAPELERPEVAEVAFVLRNIGAMDAEDIDGDNVDLRFEDAEGRDTGCDVSIVEYAEKAADLFEQHDRIVGELRADRDSWAEQAEQRLADWDEMRKERDAALAEVERLRQFERICEGLPQDAIDGGWTVQGIRGYAKHLEDQLKVALARVAELEMILRELNTSGLMQFSTADEEKAVRAALSGAQAQHSVPVAREQLERLVRILDAHNYAKDAEALMALLAAAPGNSAQHSVPIAPELKRALGLVVAALEADGDRPTSKYALSELKKVLAAAPVCRLSRSALTDAQMRRLYDSSTETENERLGFAAFARLIRRAEAVHQIAAAPGKEGV